MEAFSEGKRRKTGIRIADKKLFLRYAMPCASTLVRRGSISKPVADGLLDYVLGKKKINADIGEIFQVAYEACSKIAQDTRKREIGPVEIREYFWRQHDDVIERRFEEKKDFDKEACRIWTGKVLRPLEGSRAEVLTQRGKMAFRADFEPNLRSGDYVLVHYDFISEKVSRDDAKVMWESRNKRLGTNMLFP